MNKEEIKNKIIISFKKRTGFKNLLGSVEKVVDELFPDIEKIFKDVTLNKEHIPNKETIEAMKEIKEGKGKRVNTIEELIKELNN